MKVPEIIGQNVLFNILKFSQTENVLILNKNILIFF